MFKKLPPLLSTCVAVLIALVPLPAHAITPTVEPSCSITGTARADVLVGTAGNDIICGLGGNDTIRGGAGNDIIRGGAGNDRIDGGTGTDSVSGDAGNDTIEGGSGADVLLGNAGRDTISGGAGNDAISGGTDPDSLRSGLGTDTCARDAADRQLDPCAVDVDAPVVSFPGANILEYQAGSTIVFRWVVEDASGVAMTWAQIGGPSGWVTEWCGFAVPAERTSGTSVSGAYEVRCDIPENAVNEQYTLYVGASDALGNSNAAPGWAALGFTVNGGSADNKVPEILDVRLPATVSVGETFTVDVDVTDDSGTLGVYSWFVGAAPYYYSGPNGLLISARDSAALVSGDPTNGTFRQTLTVSSWAPPGQYSLLVSIRDTVGNRGFIQTEYSITVTD